MSNFLEADIFSPKIRSKYFQRCFFLYEQANHWEKYLWQFWHFKDGFCLPLKVLNVVMLTNLFSICCWAGYQVLSDFCIHYLFIWHLTHLLASTLYLDHLMNLSLCLEVSILGDFISCLHDYPHLLINIERYQFETKPLQLEATQHILGYPTWRVFCGELGASVITGVTSSSGFEGGGTNSTNCHESVECLFATKKYRYIN